MEDKSKEEGGEEEDERGVERKNRNRADGGQVLR